MIGTPMMIIAITPIMKKMTRFQLPISSRGPSATHSNPPREASIATDTEKSISRALVSRRATQVISIKLRPTAMADTRKALGISRAAVVMIHSSLTYSQAGVNSNPMKVITITAPRVSMKARFSTGNRAMNEVRRMCSPRRIATTEPSIASHRNSSEASSSPQTMGWLST
ncbi:hypothetical protein D3C85_1296600 [compost metagenome]